MDGFNCYVPPNAKISFQSEEIFHVFLSFKGKDVRKTFVDHLYEALSAAGLSVFLDTYELKNGEIIDLSLGAAIESGVICIPIFSKGYASSAWCLREATCMLNSPGLIIPLFYDVKPTHVRFLESDSSPYAQSFAKHYRRYQREDIQPWKESLQEICAHDGRLCICRYEGQLLKSVTSDVINSLDKVSLNVATHLVGVEDMEKALIRSRSIVEKASGLMELQRRILKDLTKYGGEVCSVEQGKVLMRDRLGGVCALVVSYKLLLEIGGVCALVVSCKLLLEIG